MRWFWLILFLFAFGLLLILLIYLGERAFKKWVLFKHPDFSRTLSKSDIVYIEEAKAELLIYRQSKNKRSHWYGLVYYLGFIPAMIGAWITGLFLFRWINVLSAKGLFRNSAVFGDIIWFEIHPVGVSAIIGLFVGIMFAGWILYVLSGFNRGFTEWMVLTKGSSGKETDEDVFQRRLTQIEHDVRVERLDVHHSFNPSDFLTSIVRRHGRYCGVLTLVIAIPMFAFLYLDVRDRDVFYEKGLTYTHYWNGSVTEVSFDELDAVHLQCAIGNKNRLQTSVHFYKAEEVIAQYDLNIFNIDQAQEIEVHLRANGVTFIPHYWHPKSKDETLAYTQKCLERLKNSRTDEYYQKLIPVLHIGEL